MTADVRYTGAATAFQERLQDQRNWLLLQAVSGAGKTRAIFDVFANSDLEKTLLYFDLSALTREGRIPTKNFYQFDVSSLGAHLGALKMDREKTKKYFEVLVAARHMVVHYLRKKGWNSESLLFAQLGLHRQSGICEASNLVFNELADKGTLLDYRTLLADSIVAIDESNVALDSSLGQFASSTKGSQARPLLCCIGDALAGWACVFSGTSFSHDQFDNAVIPNVAGASTPRFCPMTKMDSAMNVKAMMERFSIDTRNIPSDTLELLTGRCCLVARAITGIIQSAQTTPAPQTNAVILKSIQEVHRDRKRMGRQVFCLG